MNAAVHDQSKLFEEMKKKMKKSVFPKFTQWRWINPAKANAKDKDSGSRSSAAKRERDH